MAALIRIRKCSADGDSGTGHTESWTPQGQGDGFWLTSRRSKMEGYFGDGDASGVNWLLSPRLAMMLFGDAGEQIWASVSNKSRMSASAFSPATLGKSPRTRLDLSSRQPWTVIPSPFPGHGNSKGSPKYCRLAPAVPSFIVRECRFPSSSAFVPPPSPATQQKNGTTSKTFDPMYCCCLSPQAAFRYVHGDAAVCLVSPHNS